LDWGHIYDSEDQRDRDILDQRLQTAADYSFRGQTMAYRFTRRTTDNVVTNVDASTNTHLLRWNGTAAPHHRMRLTSNYTFSHRSRTQETPQEGGFLTVLSGATGLYVEDSSIDFGELDRAPALTDGNTEDPAVPRIDIGGALGDRNLGLDLAFVREVSTLHLYVDRPSGTQPTWKILSSSDNVFWQLWTANPAVEFNAGPSRYEISFESTSTRFIKVVKGGVNEVPEVLVTELEALVQVEEREKVTRKGSTHFVDAGATYRVSEAMLSTADVSYEKDFSDSPDGGRDRGDYVLGTRYQQSPVVFHHIRWQQGFQSLGGPLENLTNRSLAYSLLVTPIETLDITASATSRWEDTGDLQTDRIHTALVQLTGNPLIGINMSTEVSRTRRVQLILGTRDDVWTYRFSVDGTVTRSLEMALTYRHQRITINPGSDFRRRSQYTVDLNYRLTRTIFMRGSYNLLAEETNRVTQEYFMGWNATPKLRLSALASFTDPGADRVTERYNANLTYDLGRRTTFYSTYATSDFTEIGGTETTSFQAGMRTGF
jgi:hypothetical protein